MNYSGRRVVVMGLGHFGGGIAVTRWLVEQGAQVTITDSKSAADLAESLSRLDGLPVRQRLGGHDPADLDGCELLVVSPAVPKDKSEFVREAVRRGIPLSSEMNLFIERCPAKRVVGITGSAGKSTTTAMIGSILTTASEAGALPRVWLGGNIGHSLLGDLQTMSSEDLVVLELSSFQLEDLGALRWSPPIAVITNIQPNHLDRHGTLEAYADAKMNLVRYQSADGVVFVHEGEDEVARRVTAVGAGARLRRVTFPQEFASHLRLPGRHNRDNAAAAIAVARALGVADELIKRGIEAFTGLPHRLEFVAERDGVRYYNDSKSTTPESTRIALEAFDEPVVMLVGGYDKKIPLDGISRQLAARAKLTICYGQTGPAFHREITAAGGRAERADSFEDAVAKARAAAVPGDVVVLSPACASYDMFSNYEERGALFRQYVQAG
ncbi:MAG TPA: UDP-N-acetylmuramoyl-L-alanine--D-glutamate ligase [Phycisphaerae bacterium]|nr:UDP-N-acetylmuramoyl-L-alanine--D-glutamate ligase [Phycisphaerae bacterium]HOB73993.1 UDP-N-acetylmuramoyl-L-alanine--D-glutamate ligase [Phycisphaerae bacterium]HOL26207.1 UDP-N-acetylmuramoyl-L-alanine--D-glutamate ligase [Phycisphaerae bacterium]HPU33713.1 UDP-N-acetylmuramoyl-L-alanine--D-glutamate ligase [Phycisphaerae bacterium]HXK85360.1 UDP-N-acetylmuramoyl-L-alanine--D-glutamate ligase [Phycisphaerae bacterium]